MEAYGRVASNRGVGGVDGISLAEFEKGWQNHLYQIWNRISSGSYMLPPAKLVEIPKKCGGVRPPGVPTVADRIAQMVVGGLLEKEVEPVFHEDSYGYRPECA